MFPDITDPVYVSPQEANEFLDGDDPVFKLTFHDRTRIYPVAIMSYHHIVNDTLDNRPIAFTYCMLSDTPVLFSRNLNGRTLDLGVLGPLYYGNLVMYDKETDDRYIQLTGEKVSTQSAGQLTRLPVRITKLAWKDVDKQQDIAVLSPLKEKNFYRDFQERMAGNKLGLQVLTTFQPADDRLPPFTQGFGVAHDNQALFFPRDTVKKQAVINTRLADRSLLFAYNPENDTVSVFRRFINDRVLNFDLVDHNLTDRETGTTWNYQGQAVDGPLTGTTLPVPVYTPTYWFAWSAFHPHTDARH